MIPEFPINRDVFRQNTWTPAVTPISSSSYTHLVPRQAAKKAEGFQAGSSSNPEERTIALNDLKKHGRRSFGRSRIRRADLYDVVAEEHHFEEEGDDYVEEDDWDHEYSAYT